MRLSTVKVLRSELSSHVADIAPWELPVLRVVYPEEAVIEEGTVEIARELPEAKSEMDRLIRHYGMDNESGVPYAVQAYGHGQMGIRALEREIKAAAKPRETAVADELTA